MVFTTISRTDVTTSAVFLIVSLLFILYSNPVFSEEDFRVMSMKTLPLKTTLEYRDIIREYLAENDV